MLQLCVKPCYLDLNLSSRALLVSLLADCLPGAIPHIRVCSNVLQASVGFGQHSVEDLELRTEKNEGETHILSIM